MKKRATKKAGAASAPASITPEIAAAIVDGWAMAWLNSDEEIGTSLALFRAVTNEPDPTARENILIAIESALAPFSIAAEAALDKVVAQSQAAWLQQGRAA